MPNSMTLNDFFWRFRAATQVYIIHEVAPQNYRLEFGICILT